MSAPIRARARIVAGIIGLMALGAAATQVSADQLLGPDEVVRYGDLDLNTRAGAETLYARIETAAGHICRKSDSVELTVEAASRRCENVVVAHTVAGVRSAQLAAVYESHHSVHKPV